MLAIWNSGSAMLRATGSMAAKSIMSNEAFRTLRSASSVRPATALAGATMAIAGAITTVVIATVNGSIATGTVSMIATRVIMDGTTTRIMIATDVLGVLPG